MSGFHLIAALVSLAALAAYVNYRVLRLPAAIGIMAIVLAVSAALLALRALGIVDAQPLVEVVRSLPFGDIVLHGMLALLLFAGALHVDVVGLREDRVAVAVLSTAGLLIATAVVAALVWLGARALGREIGALEALLFGALISPTDPIAVLGILRKAGVPRRLELRITGESLFNDGVAAVLFLGALAVAQGGGLSIPGAASLFLHEVAGGLVLGALAGYAANRVLRTVDEYAVEILITLAVAMGGYTLAELLGASAPIAVVAAGLIVGSSGRAHSMSERTRRRLDDFWELADYLLNAILFALIGLQVLALDFASVGATGMLLVLAAVPIVLLGRLVSVALPLAALPPAGASRRAELAVLTWGGLRGGISIALALSLPDSGNRDLLLAATYAVVLVSVLLQGPTLGPLARRAMPV